MFVSLTIKRIFMENIPNSSTTSNGNLSIKKLVYWLETTIVHVCAITGFMFIISFYGSFLWFDMTSIKLIVQEGYIVTAKDSEAINILLGQLDLMVQFMIIISIIVGVLNLVSMYKKPTSD